MSRETPHEWRAYLHSLPDASPAPDLWQRLALEHAARRGSARMRWLPATGLAAAVALAAVIAWPGQTPTPLAPPAVAAAGDAMALRALDDAIALAYASDASQDELDALWQTRERVMKDGSGEAPMLARL